MSAISARQQRDRRNECDDHPGAAITPNSTRRGIRSAGTRRSRGNRRSRERERPAHLLACHAERDVQSVVREAVGAIAHRVLDPEIHAEPDEQHGESDEIRLRAP
jgi:hypothetical protein